MLYSQPVSSKPRPGQPDSTQPNLPSLALSVMHMQEARCRRATAPTTELAHLVHKGREASLPSLPAAELVVKDAVGRIRQGRAG